MSRPLRVLLFGPIPPPNGGVQTHLMALAGYLGRSGAEVGIVNLTRHRQPEQGGHFYPVSAAGVLARIARFRPDVMHVHLGGNLNRRGLGLCAVAGCWPGAVSLMTFHSGGYPSSPAGRAARPGSAAGVALRQLDHLIAVNPEIEDLFHRFGVDRGRTSVIEPHSEVAPTAAAELPPTLAAFREAHDPLFVAVGGLEPEYCVPLQVEAMRSIVDRLPGAGLMVIGSGSQANEVAATVAASPVSSRILVAGDVPHRATLRAIDAADVFLRITAYDGDSLSVREALGLGVPVLATDNGMRPPGVELVAPLTPEAVAHRAVELALRPRANRRAPAAPVGDANLARVLGLYRRLRGIEV